VVDQFFESLLAYLEGLWFILDILASHVDEAVDISQILSIIISISLHEKLTRNARVLL
jgi:hypothetical protein